MIKQHDSYNPYVKGALGRKEWNDRYLNMKQIIFKWQIAFFALLIVNMILAIGMVKIARSNKIQPFVVETNKGMPYTLHKVDAIPMHDEKLINYAMNQFIINARTIINDSEAQKTFLNKLYAYSAENTISFLHDYYQQNNPFARAMKSTVTVSIVSSLPISKNTWQITWDEIAHASQSGAVLSTTRWIANMNYKFGKVNMDFLNDNPFGIYITNVTWAPSQI
jgi:type IV secretion system protein TrbF